MNLELLHNYIVYKHTSPNDKVYIGITKFDPKYRWMSGHGYETQRVFFNAIIKYGWINFKHEVLFSELTEKEALDKEQEMIMLYKSYDRRYGYNISLRGAIYGKNVNREINKKERIINKPRWSHLGREVEQRDKNGNLIKTFKSVREAADFVKVHQESIRTRLNKYKILYYDTFTLSYAKEKELPKIEMLTLSNELLKTFNNTTEASNFLGEINKGKISQVCRNIRKSYRGYKWRYKYENSNN